MKKLLFVLFLLLGCTGRPAANVAQNPTMAADDPWPAGSIEFEEIRIGLKVGEARVEWEAGRETELRDLAGRKLGRTLGTGRWGASRDGDAIVLWRGGREVVRSKTTGLWMRAAPTSPSWKVGGDEFSGDLAVVRAGNGGLNLVNVVQVEEYLRGVVPWEIGRPEEGAVEAVKAQAIAARTYTYSHRGHWASSGFDLFADVRDQVYRGRTGTSDITDRAVEETAGRVVTYQGELIRAYYSSTSGGHTSTLTDVWSKQGAPYLQGIRDADERGRSWCVDSPHFRWTETWSARELGDIVREQLPIELDVALDARSIGRLDSLEVVERDLSGRVQRLRIHTDTDQFELWGDRIRWLLRPARGRIAILRSTMFSLEHIRRDGRLVGVIARGGGFGHGVGLCQTGALGRARAGESHETILRAYYSGVRVVDVRSLGSARGVSR